MRRPERHLSCYARGAHVASWYRHRRGGVGGRTVGSEPAARRPPGARQAARRPAAAAEATQGRAEATCRRRDWSDTARWAGGVGKNVEGINTDGTRQAGRQAGKQTGKQASRQADRQVGR